MIISTFNLSILDSLKYLCLGEDIIHISDNPYQSFNKTIKLLKALEVSFKILHPHRIKADEGIIIFRHSESTRILIKDQRVVYG